MQAEYTKLKAWLLAPFNNQTSVANLILIFIALNILSFIVWDNLNILKKGLRV